MFVLVRGIIYEVTINKLFHLSSKCFKVPFPLLNFDDAIPMKLLIDKGGGSTRPLLNFENVRKP